MRGTFGWLGRSVRSCGPHALLHASNLLCPCALLLFSPSSHRPSTGKKRRLCQHVELEPIDHPAAALQARPQRTHQRVRLSSELACLNIDQQAVPLAPAIAPAGSPSSTGKRRRPASSVNVVGSSSPPHGPGVAWPGPFLAPPPGQQQLSNERPADSRERPRPRRHRPVRRWV